MVYWWK